MYVCMSVCGIPSKQRSRDRGMWNRMGLDGIGWDGTEWDCGGSGGCGVSARVREKGTSTEAEMGWG
jgi:hypothetical protein